MGEGNNALACAASKVGRRAFVVQMVSRPAIPAAPIIGAIAGLMPRVLAVAPETVDVGWECSLAFPKGTTGWRPWVFDCSSLQAVFSLAVLWVRVGGSLCCMDTRDDAAGRGLGASAKEMRDQACPNRRVCQVALHLVLFLFSFELLPSQLNPLLSDGGKAKVLLPQGVDVCNDPCVSQVEECVIYHGAIDGRRVEEGQLRITRSVPIEIGMGERSGV